jgi:hypothetical protein
LTGRRKYDILRIREIIRIFKILGKEGERYGSEQASFDSTHSEVI